MMYMDHAATTSPHDDVVEAVRLSLETQYRKLTHPQADGLSAWTPALADSSAGGSYGQRMVHRDTEALASRILEDVDGTRERILGIEGEAIVERTGPETAAIPAIVGAPRQRPPRY